MTITLEEFVEEMGQEAPHHDESVARIFFENDYGTSWDGDFKEVFERFEDAYSGVWDSEEDFAADLADDIGMVDDETRYFDYKAFTRDLFLGDYWAEKLPSGEVVVFRSI